MELRFLSSILLWILVASSLPLGLGATEKRRGILYLGDSLSIGAFGQTFDAAMRAGGHRVHTVVAGGASPYYWLKNYQPLPCTIGFWEKTDSTERRVAYVRAVPKLEDLMDEGKPAVVVVQTGINLYATLRSKRRAKEENIATVRSLIDQMCQSIASRGAVSYWILPPHSHEARYPKELQDELASIMREVVGRHGGTVFESSEVTRFVDPYPATDGIHYGPAEARAWAQRVSGHFASFVGSTPSSTEPALAESPAARAIPESRPDPAPTAASMTAPAPLAPAPAADENVPEDIPAEIALRVRLEEKSEITNVSELDYANALGLFEYSVVKDLRGNFPHDRIRIAQGVVFGRRLTGAARVEIGSEAELVLVPLSRYQNLERWQMFDDLRPNAEIPIYTPKLN